MSHTIEEAARIYASLKVVVALLRGDDDDTGLIEHLEQTTTSLNAAIQESEKQRKKALSDLDLSGLERELKQLVHRIADDVSLSTADILSDKSLQSLNKSSSATARSAAIQALKHFEKKSQETKKDWIPYLLFSNAVLVAAVCILSIVLATK